MMRRLTALLMILLLVASLALAQDATPAVQDRASVLSEGTLSDALQLSQRLKDATGVHIYTIFQHFLGGEDIQAAADNYLAALPDSAQSLLLLAAIGEDSYALAAGSEAAQKLPREARNNLLATSFREPFLKQNYNLALASFMGDVSEQLARAAKVSVNTGSYFDEALATPGPQPEGYRSIRITKPEDLPWTSPSPWEDRERVKEKDKGMSWFSIIAIGLVLSAVFGNKEKRRGCGCGPLGWIFGTFGISKLFGWRK